MARRLLTELMASCTHQELNQIQSWLESPAHNQKASITRLFNFLREHLHEIGVDPSPQKAFAHAFPGKAFKESVWSKANFELTQQIEDCLSYQRFARQRTLCRPLILELYREKGMHRHLEVRLRRYQRDYQKSPKSTVEDFRYGYQLQQQRYLQQSENKRSNKHNLEEVNATLLEAVYAEQFRQFGRTLAHQRLFQESVPPPLLSPLITAYEGSPSPEFPGIHLFYLATLLYLKPIEEADEIFTNLKVGISSFTNDGHPTDLRDLLVHAINYGVRQTNAGREAYIRQTLELYQIGMEQSLFYQNGEIDIFTFNNIMGLALRLEEITYAEAFLNENADKLPQEKRQEVASLNRARLAFRQQDFSTALHHLQTADYQDFIHHLTARVLQLKIYFERDDYNLLVSHIRSTKTLLGRRKNQGYHRNNYKNIFTLAEQVLKLPPRDQTAKKALAQKIRLTEPCTEKDWLLSRLNDYR